MCDVTPEPEPRDRLSVAQRIAHQREQLRAAQQRAAQLHTDELEQAAALAGGPATRTTAGVPWGVDLAASWAWRLLAIGAAAYFALNIVAFFSVVALPLAVALLISALVNPLVQLMRRLGLPQGLSALVVVVVGIGSVVLLLTFAGQQVANGASDLADQVVKGLGQVKAWLKDGPLNASDSQINQYLERAQKAITERTQDGQVFSHVTEVGTAVGHVLAGFFIVLFATYFFLADGRRIWSWVVRLAPRAARDRVNSSGQVAWVSLTQFVRATVIVAIVDAVGIMIVAAVLRVPFVLAIGVLVFLGAFVPMIGATIAGTVAVLVALVDQGPITALLMLGGVILVQQIEGHILQPFLMGRWVSVHPLAVIVAIACGVLVAGIAGALIAVPLAASANAVVQHLAAGTDVGDDPEDLIDAELFDDGPDPDLTPEAEIDGAVGDVPEEERADD